VSESYWVDDSIWPIGSSYPLLIVGSSYSSSSLFLVNLDLMRMAVLIDSSFNSDRSSIYGLSRGSGGLVCNCFYCILKLELKCASLQTTATIQA
jgi:hypothetical protein